MRRLLFAGFFPAMYLIFAAVDERSVGSGMIISKRPRAEIMQSAFRELNMFYVDDLAPGELMETGISAMLADLDPYTRYYPEYKIEDVRFIQTGEYGGVGATIESRNGETVIMDLLEGEPADRAGIQRGDVVKRVDGRDIAGLNQDQIGELFGAAGTNVSLELQRPGSNGICPSRLKGKGQSPRCAICRYAFRRNGLFVLEFLTSTASLKYGKP